MATDFPATRSRQRDWIEAGVAYALILAVIWTPRPWQRILYWAPVLWILGATCLSFRASPTFGLRVTNLLRSSWVILVAVLMAAAAVVTAVHLGTLHSPNSLALFFRSYIGYAIWSLVQQFLMVVFFLSRLTRLMPARTAAVIAAGIFAVAHLPNPVLTPMTMIWGLAACLIFLEYRNLWTLGIAHAIFGIAVAITIPANITHGMRVGIGYVRYHPHTPHDQRRNSDQMLSTQACVTAEAPTRRS